MAEGGSGSYSVVLSTLPAGDVTVTISGAAGDVSVSGTSLTNGVLTFTTGNWSVPQTITVNAAEDPDTATDDDVDLVHAVASSDSAYDNLADQTVTVTVVENDAAVVIDPTELTVVEGGSGSYSVVLSTLPAGDVTVTISGAAGDVSVSGTTLTNGVLTFTTLNWSVPQTITVNAAEDPDTATDDDVDLVHAIASTDSAYDNLADQTVTVTVVENDAAVVIDPTELSVVEGGSGSYSVVLSTLAGG